ncbi:hypothetical protein EMCRGX_G001609 [Ephydatia muelleri]
MQIELLVKLVEAKNTESPEPTRTGENELRVVKLTDRDDIEAYLTTFERLMAAYSVPRAKWIIKLAPQITGKAQQAYAALTTEDALSYDERFRAAVRSHEESHRDLSIRLGDLANKWLRGVNTVELVKEAIIQEQLLNSLTPAVQVWVKERKPKTALEAGQLADDYTEARRQSTKDDQVISVPAPGTKTSSQPSKEDGGPSHSRDKQPFRPGHWHGDYLSTVTCYKCGKQGHVASREWDWWEGREVKDIVLDIGCSKTIVHHSLVPEKKLVTGEAVTIRCAHGDSVLYPLANVDLVIDGVPLTVEAAVSKSLPVSVLLGTDVPELAKFVGGKARGARRQGNEAWMVVTRAGARKQEEEEKTLLQKEKDSQVRPSPVETELAEAQSVDAGGAEIECADTAGCTLDDDLFSGGRSKVKLTRSQKRAQKQLHQHKMGTGALDISAVELQVLQKGGPLCG